MVSITQATREIVSRQPFLEDALARGIINYNSLAAELLEQVSLQVGSRVNPTSVAMALRRIGASIKMNHFERVERRLREFVDSDTTIKYDLFELTIQLGPTDDISKILKIFYETDRFRYSDYLSLTKGISELSIIANHKHRDYIHSKVADLDIKSEVLGLASVAVSIPEDSLQIPGLFFYFSKALTTAGINIIELISTFSEIQFIVEEPDVLETSKIVRSLIREGSV